MFRSELVIPIEILAEETKLFEIISIENNWHELGPHETSV